MKRKICIAAMTMLVVLLMAVPAWASVGFDINGRNYIPSSSPVVKDGITCASAQMLSETLGAQLTTEGDNITLTENQNILKMKVGSTTALFNGAEKVMPRAPEISGNDILLPIRFIYECFGAKVNWNYEKQKIDVTYNETRNGMLPEEMLTKASQIMQKSNTYKMSGDINYNIQTKSKPVTGETKAESLKMDGHIDGSVKYDPMLIYMTENMKLTSAQAGQNTIDVNIEMLFNNDNMYMKMPQQGWVKMSLPSMDMGKMMEQSMAQDPIDSIAQMQKLGMSIAFANDGERDGKKYWVVEVTMGGDALNQYLQQFMAQIPGISGDTKDLYKNLKMDMSYRTWINQETMNTDYMDLDAKYTMGMDVTKGSDPGHMDIATDMTAAYKLYDFGVLFSVPDVSNAKDYSAITNQPGK